MARDLGQLLGPSLNAGPVPDSGPALVDYAGGRAALVAQLTGRDHAPRRSEFRDATAFEAERTRWRTAQRNVQRWDKGRHPTLTSSMKGKLHRAANVRKRAALRRRGMRMRLRGEVVVPSPMARHGNDVRVRDLPSGGPAQYLDPAIVGQVLDALDEDGEDAAAEELLASFLEEYAMPLDTEITNLEYLHLWPDGEEELA